MTTAAPASLTVDTTSPRATRALGRRLGALLAAGDVVGLVGDLGAGKTTFVQGLAEGLGVPATVKVRSPTFTVVNTYEGGRVPLHHLDLYRLRDAESLYALGYDDYLGGAAVCVVEWLDQVPEAAPPDYLRVELRDEPDLASSSRRTLGFHASGPRSAALLDALAQKPRGPARRS